MKRKNTLLFDRRHPGNSLSGVYQPSDEMMDPGLRHAGMTGWRKTQWLVGISLAICFGFKNAWASTPADATITITPVANVSLAISPTTYSFGTLSVNVSSNSATKLTLSNNGQVDVSVDKRITNESNPAGWTAGTTPAVDTYALYVATSTSRPNISDFTTGSHQFGVLNNVTSLEGLGGGVPIMTTSAGILPSVDLWFKLDMPTTVSSQVARAITVRFTGTAQ